MQCETGNVPVSPMPSQALPEQSFLWRRTARRQPEPTVSTATAQAPVQWYSNPAVTAEASVNGYSRRNIWQFLLDSLCLSGPSIDPNQLSSTLELPVNAPLCKCSWILFTLTILSAHLLPFKTSWNSHQRKFCRHSAGRVSILILQGRDQCIHVRCCCKSSQRVECCYDSGPGLLLHH